MFGDSVTSDIEGGTEIWNESLPVQEEIRKCPFPKM